MLQAANAGNMARRIQCGEDLEVKASPDPLETCPWEVRFKSGDRALLAKVETEPAAELIKAAFVCMHQTLVTNAPQIIREEVAKKLGEIDLP